MIVISYGLRKSGSTMAFEMTKAVLELNGHPQPRLSDTLVEGNRRINFVGKWSDDLLSRLAEATRGARIVIKTHTPPDRISTGVLLRSLESGAVKIQVVYRDPRDIALSMLDHGARSRAKNTTILSQVVDVDAAIAQLRSDLKALRHWGVFPSLKLLYDDIAFDPRRGPQLIADYLDVTADPAEVWEMVNVRRTKKKVARPRRHHTEMSSEDSARIADAVPNYLRLVEDNDLGWFQALG